ncbi:MAG: hypothetical protein QXH71_01315 [Candidatus Anstonellaceae archaeon]
MKGLIYSLSLYLLFIILIELYLLTLNFDIEVVKQQIYFEDQKEIVKILDQISNILKNKLEINISSYRNESIIIFRIEDKGFPLGDYGPYQKNFTPFLEFLEKIGEIKNCTLQTNLSMINESGKIILTNFGINYSHNNSNLQYDQIKIKIDPNSQINRIKIKLKCTRPSSAQTVSYVDWQTTGNNIAFNITFLDANQNHENYGLIDTSSPNNFSAAYHDSQGNMIYKVKLDYNPDNYEIIFWSETNSTYNPPYTKINVSCGLEFEANINSYPHSEIYAFFPMQIKTNCKNVNYSGDLVVFKK